MGVIPAGKAGRAGVEGAAQIAPNDPYFAAMGEDRRKQLASNVTAGLPGAVESWSLPELSAHLATYDGVSPERLRRNLVDFLAEVAPVAQEIGVRLCCHPDDPPFPLLGLPRIMSTEADYRTVLDTVDLPASGVTFCTGSLGARRRSSSTSRRRRPSRWRDVRYRSTVGTAT